MSGIDRVHQKLSLASRLVRGGNVRGLYPTLAPDETLLEGALTPEAFRGQRIACSSTKAASASSRTPSSAPAS